MTENQKETVRQQVNTAAQEGAKKAAAAAKVATGWKKWGLIALATLLAGIALFTQVGCEQLGRVTVTVTPEQVQQAHGAYHVLTGQPCIFRVETVKNVK